MQHWLNRQTSRNTSATNGSPSMKMKRSLINFPCRKQYSASSDSNNPDNKSVQIYNDISRAQTYPSEGDQQNDGDVSAKRPTTRRMQQMKSQMVSRGLFVSSFFDQTKKQQPFTSHHNNQPTMSSIEAMEAAHQHGCDAHGLMDFLHKLLLLLQLHHFRPTHNQSATDLTP